MKKVVIILVFLSFVMIDFAHTKIFYADGPKDVKKISLTFDDGPGKSTAKILEILKEKNVKATFFMLGIRVQNDPDTAKAVAVAGHEIGNHTYGHINFYAYKGEDKIDKMKKEILRGKNIIKKVTGIDPFLVRFSYGYSRFDAIEVIRNSGCYLINWSFGCDWTAVTAEEMHNKYKKALKNGVIFLMHDLPKNKKVLSFLSSFIDEIIEAGYEIVPVSQLLNIEQVCTNRADEL
ncbi:MAG: polysaccharide deacetylase family protein [Endomicrobium sp.]|nr:polysaccharide deacetylase family protein [Endomicrobium sp.]